MTEQEPSIGRSPHRDLALEIIAADLGYAYGALARPDALQGWPFIQYAVMVAFEARQFLEQQLGIALDDPLWSPAVASAARMSGKYFDDSDRKLDGVVSYFEELVAANHSAFFPPDRLVPSSDNLRDDLAVATLDGMPILTNISGHFLSGMSPEVSMDWVRAGRQLYDLASGVGHTIASVIGVPVDGSHTGPVGVDGREVAWWDSKAWESFPQTFCGDLAPPLTAAMLTIQGATVTASELARSTCCAACEFAALKHRLIVTYQSVRSLSLLRESGRVIGTPSERHLDEALSGADEDAALILSRGVRRLRNGLLHLGLTDVPVAALGDSPNLDAVARYYTEGHTLEEISGVVDRCLARVSTTLTRWCLTPPQGGKGLAATLRTPQP